jgi:hypothetical protein
MDIRVLPDPNIIRVDRLLESESVMISSSEDVLS